MRLLANPGHNRIYFDTALKIAVSELQAIADAYDMEIKEIGEGRKFRSSSINMLLALIESLRKKTLKH
ncbi:hypothetical protein ACSXE3_15105 (plasmid) [Clostridium perfringens]